MSNISKYNGSSAYGLKPLGIDTREMNGVYTPNTFDTSSIKFYIDPARSNFYSGTSFTPTIGSGTGTFYGGMESGYIQNGWFNTDAVNDYATFPAFTLGTEWTMLYWGYASRLTSPNLYAMFYTDPVTNGVRMDLGQNPTATWARVLIASNTGTTQNFTNTQPQGYWYLQYAAMKSGISTRYGCSEVAGTFDHRVLTPVTVTAGPVNIFKYWGNGVHFSIYEEGKVGELWIYDRELANAEIEQIYNNTKKRYGY